VAEEVLITQRTKSQPTPVQRSLLEAHSSPANTGSGYSSTLHLPSASPPGQAQHSKKGTRQSRLSVHTFFHGFSRSGTPIPSGSGNALGLGINSSASGVSSSALPIVSAERPSISDIGPRKLRKTRSIPDMSSGAPGIASGPDAAGSSSVYLGASGTGRAHSRTVTGADLSAVPRLYGPSVERHAGYASQLFASSTAALGDTFAATMGWAGRDEASASASASTSQITSPVGSQTGGFPSFSVALGEQGSAGSSSGRGKQRKLFAHPFGGGIAFNVPATKGDGDGEGADIGLGLDLEGSDEEQSGSDRRHTPLAGTPQHGSKLRLMQSFESGLTAIPGDTMKLRMAALKKRSVDEPGVDAGTDMVPPSPVAEEYAAETESPAPEILPELYVIPDADGEDAPGPAPSSPSKAHENEHPVIFDPINEPAETVSPETRIHTRYNTKVFDVLQTYRGLPALDKLLDQLQETIKISLEADVNSTQPRNDPRFVIWGEVSGGLLPEDDGVSGSPGTDADSANRSGPSRHRSGTRRGQRAGPERAAGLAASTSSKNEDTGGDAPTSMLVAATIERWIAQLTSELNYEELLIFFLTYRAYVGPIELAHLLICRFHWALERQQSARDDMVRKIVRLRTYVAIKFWIGTFFLHDFVPNRELRLLLASWLNALRKDTIVLRNRDALVRSCGCVSEAFTHCWIVDHRAQACESCEGM
jgi:Gdp/GTP exchange factor required for growth at low temperatures